MGVGGGSVSTLVLMLYGTPIHMAVGISAGIGVLISIARHDRLHDRRLAAAGADAAALDRLCVADRVGVDGADRRLRRAVRRAARAQHAEAAARDCVRLVSARWSRSRFLVSLIW